MKVYDDSKSEYILIRKPKYFNKDTEFMVLETEEEIRLIKLKELQH